MLVRMGLAYGYITPSTLILYIRLLNTRERMSVEITSTVLR